MPKSNNTGGKQGKTVIPRETKNNFWRQEIKFAKKEYEADRSDQKNLDEQPCLNSFGLT